MVRLMVAVFVGVLLCALALRVANTPWVGPLAVLAVCYAVLLSFLDSRERRNLEVWERKERLRDEKRRRAA